MEKTNKIDVNSIVNQKIKGDFVAREVKTCFSYEMESILRSSAEHNNKEYPLPSYDDIKNMYYFDKENAIYSIMREYDDSFLEYSNNKETYNRRCKTESDFERFLNSLDNDELEETAKDLKVDIDDYLSVPNEIYEWWIVTEFLYEHLQKLGEPVLEWGNNYYWGRTCSGQAILLDGVISDICKEMEILDGQKSSWAID